MFKRNITIIKDYFKLVNIKNKYLVMFIIFNILFDLCELVIPVAASFIIEYVTEGSYNEAFFTIFILFILYLLNNFLLYWDYFSYANFFKRCYTDLHTKVVNSIYEFDDYYTTKISSGKIVNTCNMDLINTAELPSYLFSLINQSIKLIIIIIVFMRQNFFIGIYVICINLLYCHFSSICNSKNALYFQKQRKYADKLTGLLSQTLSGLRDIKSFNFSDRLNNKFDIYRKKWEQGYYLKRRYFFIKETVVVGIVQIGKILMYIFLVLLLASGNIDLAIFLLLISYYEKFKETTKSLMNSNMSIIEESISMYRIKDIINYNKKAIDSYGNNEKDDVVGKIEFKGVYFKYQKSVTLHNISFCVNPNELTVIVGPTGSGKTTLFNLLLRFYKIDRGKILIDDIDIYDFSKEIYSSNIAIVNQKTFIFNMSIRDNLSLVDSNKERQINACKRVGIHDFIMSLPNGYNTVLKEDATNISGGQKQLLSLARALLTTSEIILLDEVTSSLDPNTTQNIINLLSDLKTDHTIILITHKKEEMQQADQLIVLNSGKIVGIGNHKKLIKENSYYRDLFYDEVL